MSELEDQSSDSDELFRDPRYLELAVKLAGELALSREPGKLMKYWREKTKIPQVRLARDMGLSPSVLSDYESGRRKSPGALFIKKFVRSLVRLDMEAGFLTSPSAFALDPEAVLGIGEFKGQLTVGGAVEKLSLELLSGEEQLGRPLYGYTVLDSIKAIYALSGYEFYKIFGSTTERILVFTRVGLGRSPLVAIRVSQLKPRMVVIHGPEKMDPLAVDLAKRERIVLAVARGITVQGIIDKLRSL